ncbi:MAG: DUF4381 domain-containing protein [Luminiphilus sp.]|jgi:hypothetical protein|nr:DUF4381 domain-containing protein [Luminiphilus sp.]MDG2037366.1 DUF4381 domain-containing protein [Luminiphilus sp.]
MMLAQLAPLREPLAVGWWPLAPGWWALLSLAVAVLIALAMWYRRRRQKNRYRRLALLELAHLREQRAKRDQLNRLLKAAALRAFPQERIASLHGQSWLAFLVSTCKGISPSAFDELNQLYQREQATVSETLFDAAEHWIRRHEADHA